jgi:hypothetical protein
LFSCINFSSSGLAATAGKLNSLWRVLIRHPTSLVCFF